MIEDYTDFDPRVESDRGNGRIRVQTVITEPSKTVQSDRHKAEMKEILRKYEAVGIVSHLRNVDLQYRDVSEFTDFADVTRQLKDAELKFNELPSKVREIFDHSVENWLDAAHDPNFVETNRVKLEKAGLIKPVEKPVTPPDSEPASPPTPTD